MKLRVSLENDKMISFITNRQQINYAPRRKLYVGLCAVVSFCLPLQGAYASGKKIQSGQTQVVASVGKREITLNELRIEMSRLGFSASDNDAERKALRSLTDRVLILAEAKSLNMHKQPEALWRMEAAKDQALAEMYMGLISQAPEPTQTDVENFVIDNPTLFNKAKRYTFSVLDMGIEKFDLEKLTPYFDEQQDFTALQAYLKEQEVPYTLSSSVRSSSAFPKGIRQQLANYGLGDNIVLNGALQTSILKIINIANASVNLEKAGPIARVLLKQEEAQGRVRRKLNSLRKGDKVVVYRVSARPVPVSETDSR